MAGRVGLVGLDLFVATEEHTQQGRVQFESCEERRGDQTCWIESARTDRES